MGLVSIQPETAGAFLQVNRAMSELLGYSEDELSRLSVRDVTHPDDLPETTEELTRVIAGDSSGFDLEKRYVRADGSVIWGLLHVSLVRDTSGAPLYVIGQVQNITEWKTAREQLARQALHDDLTGLSNRRKLSRISRSSSRHRARRRHSCFSSTSTASRRTATPSSTPRATRSSGSSPSDSSGR